MKDTHYTISHTVPGIAGGAPAVDTRWFSDRPSAERHARTVVRLGYAPNITAQDNTPQGYINARPSTLGLAYTAWALIHQAWWAKS